jgi:SAM-dependent methyltransferase
MSNTVFDRVARDYEKIHNRSLPPGVSSDEFVRQKAEHVVRWIRESAGAGEFCYLDFGCGNGRLFRFLLDSSTLAPLLAGGRLRLFGVEPSAESLVEAKRIAGGNRVCFARRVQELPAGIRFDLVVSCNVFHHIPPSERAATADALRARMKPNANLVIWEHNPFNPFSRLLVKFCPFDEDACLLTLAGARRLLAENGFRHVKHAYVNLFPPSWQRLKFVSRIESRLAGLPVGAQYWVMVASHEVR